MSQIHQSIAVSGTLLGMIFSGCPFVMFEIHPLRHFEKASGSPSNNLASAGPLGMITSHLQAAAHDLGTRLYFP